MNISPFEMMVGSEKKADYFVIAKKKIGIAPVYLGLKPIMGVLPYIGPAIGIRLRSSWGPAHKEDGSGPLTFLRTAEILTSAWEKVEFSKADKDRASSTMLTKVNANKGYPGVREDIVQHDLAKKIAEVVLEKIGGEHLSISPDSIEDIIREGWFAQLDQMSSKGADIVQMPKAANPEGDVSLSKMKEKGLVLDEEQDPAESDDASDQDSEETPKNGEPA